MADRLKEDFRTQIRTGALTPGDLILSISELSARYGINRSSVQNALGALEREGYLRTVHGSGIFVSTAFKKRQVRLFRAHYSAIGSLFEQIARSGPWEVVSAQAAADADVICCAGSRGHDLWHAGSVLALDSRLAEEPPAGEGWAPTLRENYMAGGVVFGVPIYGAPVVLFYNPALFERAEVPRPADGWTWPDFENSVRALRAVCDVEKAGVLPFHDRFSAYAPFFMQNGVELISSDPVQGVLSAAAQETIAFLRTIRLVAGGTLYWGNDELLARFLAGDSAMMLHSGTMFRLLHEHQTVPWAWAPLPGKRGRATITFSEGLHIAAGTDKPGVAWDFVRFCLSNASQNALVALHLPFPARLDMARAFIDRHGAGYAPLLDEMSRARPEHGAPGAGLWSMLGEAMSGWLDPRLTERDLHERCRAAAAAVDVGLRARRRREDDLVGYG
ncbi:MAG: extracellular solute-binding protein [Kiritimatiellae bacterium]|nr:extracellular solute-binding protein [Kiritimatiellia bacterium]